MEIKTSETYNKQWYIFKNCKQHGPLSSEEICNLLLNNQINKDHHVWNESINDWTSIKDIEDFKNIGFNPVLDKNKISFVEHANNKKTNNKHLHIRTKTYKGLWDRLKAYFSK